MAILQITFENSFSCFIEFEQAQLVGLEVNTILRDVMDSPNSKKKLSSDDHTWVEDWVTGLRV